MMQDKTESIKAALEDFSLMAYGCSRKGALAQGTCVQCTRPVKGFKDEISAREYELSGLCQECQDAFFES